MEALMRELVPHLPADGLFAEPDIPFRKLHNAIEDYARKMRRSEVVVLYDATRMGSGKDGALFATDRFIFQNTNLEPAHEVKYTDLVGVELKKKLMGGSKIMLQINRGRATIDLEMDFSARGKAAPYVARFLEDAMIKTADEEAVERKQSAILS